MPKLLFLKLSFNACYSVIKLLNMVQSSIDYKTKKPLTTPTLYDNLKIGVLFNCQPDLNINQQ